TSPQDEKPLTTRSVILAWSPWIIMAVFLVVSGFLRERETDKAKGPIDLGIAKSMYIVDVPTLHNEVERAYQLQKLVPPDYTPVPGEPDVYLDKKGNRVPVQDGASGPKLREREEAKFKFTWLTAPGTPVILAAFVSMLLLRMSPRQILTV